jgi:sodium/potassium-transporting ATPase subunit alpha
VQWAAAIDKDELVFARTTPEQKTEIVQRYQAAGHCVIACGDGANDAPALKQANVGVSMGSLRASDVAKEAADVVICDDDFAHIIELVYAGRLVYANIRKTIAYVITHGVPELVPTFCAIVFNLPLALTAPLILIVDLVTEQLPTISLAYEGPESLLMSVPPRNLRTDHLVDARIVLHSFVIMALLESLACMGAFLLVLSQRGYPISTLLYNKSFWSSPPPAAAAALAEGVGAYFFTLVVTQACMHVYLVKTSRQSVFTFGVCANRLTAVGSAVAIGVAVLCIFPLRGAFFGTGGMPQATSWTLCFAFLVVALPLTEAAKAVARRWPRGVVSRQLLW